MSNMTMERRWQKEREKESPKLGEEVVNVEKISAKETKKHLVKAK